MEVVRYTFSGSIGTERLEVPYGAGEFVGRLQEESSNIEDEIADELAEMAGVAPTVSIRFRANSIDWSGFVEFVWASAETMATVGGAIALLHMVRTTINSALRRWFRRVSNGSFPDPKTYVLLARGPSAERRAVVQRAETPPYMLLFAVAACIASLAALVAAVGVVIVAVGKIL